MRLILFTVIAALLAGLLAGGSLRDFPTVKTRWWGLALAGVALQFITIGGTAVAIVLLYASFTTLLVFAAVNVRAPGFALILIGLALNTQVIVANGGMPVSEQALVASGQSDTLTELRTDHDGQKHSLADDRTLLLPLGDVIAIEGPVRQAVSIGDLFVHLGIGWFIVVAMRRPNGSLVIEPVEI